MPPDGRTVTCDITPTSFVELEFRRGFSDVPERLRDDSASRSPWFHKAMVSRLEFSDVRQKTVAA
jgi:hypothetical protein